MLSHNISGKRSHSLLALCGSFCISTQRGFLGISSCISLHLRFQPIQDLVSMSMQMLTHCHRYWLLNQFANATLPRMLMHKRSRALILVSLCQTDLMYSHVDCLYTHNVLFDLVCLFLYTVKTSLTDHLSRLIKCSLQSIVFVSPKRSPKTIF